MKEIFFVSGLPRSGSTLLCSLLSQNPENHCTPTNDLIELIVGVQKQWTGCESFRAQGLENLVPKIKNVMLSMINGFHTEDKIIFDKSRGWIAYIELLEEILGKKVKVIVTVRDIRDMVASLEKLHRENNISKPNINQASTIMDRCKQYLSVDATLGLSLNRLKDCFDKGLSDRLIIVPYHCLVESPIETISQIHLDLGLADFKCNPNKIENTAYENDEVYGRPFHKLRDMVDYSAIGRWKEFLTEDVAEWLVQEYPSIQNLAHGSYSSK